MEARMNLSCTIMAHPDRIKLVDALEPRLGFPPVIWDRHNNRWDTGRRSLLAHVNTGSDYALVVQDDAVVPPRFFEALKAALVRVPDGSPLVLYATRTQKWGPVLDQVPRAASYLVMDRIWWGVGVVVPTSVIPELVEFGDTCDNPHYDHRLGSFFESRRVPVWYTWPNLLDHQQVPSLIEGRSARRRAHYFVRGRADRLKWSGQVVRVEPPEGIVRPER